jgi:diguanylate cyclase (GGDEF)-like protein
MQLSIGRGPATGAKAPFLLVLGGGMLTALGILALLVSSLYAPKAMGPQMIGVAALVGVQIVMLAGTCLYGFRHVVHTEKSARARALTDALTGLPNRRALLDAIARQMRRQPSDQALAFIDLEGVEAINDTHGREAGDELMVAVAKTLTARLPRGAMLARLGGDEFAILAGDNRGLETCRAFARAALDDLDRPLALSTGPVRIGASIGIAHLPAGEHSAQELFRRAGLAMVNAKQAATGRIVEYDGAIDTLRAERQQIEAEIRCGLINGEFDVAYQPICRAGTHEVEAVEALVRWPRRPDGELGPDAFIAAADNSGTIHRLGLFVLKQACSDLADVDGVRLHVNISPVQFRHPEFELNLKATLDETGFPAHRLELEITERHILENPERARALIASLAAKGIGFALDDFGAGVSGIGHLQRFGLRRVKIDRALVATIGHDPKAGSLLTGAVSIAHALSLGVVAEGVETEDQERLLRLVGCDLLQGYRYGRPAPFADIVGRLPGADLAQIA